MACLPVMAQWPSGPSALKLKTHMQLYTEFGILDGHKSHQDGKGDKSGKCHLQDEQGRQCCSIVRTPKNPPMVLASNH